MHKKLKPKEGIVFRDPKSGEIFVGRRVKMNSFWLRRLRAGEVVEVKEAQAPEVKEAPKVKETPIVFKAEKVEEKK